MLKKMIERLGFVPAVERDDALAEASRTRITARSLSHTVEAQDAEIARMADRYAALRTEQAGVVAFLMRELAEARS